MGMVAIARIAEQSGLLDVAAKDKIIKILQSYGLPTEIPEKLDRKKIKEYLLADKKVESGKVVYVIPVKIGEVILTADVEEKLVDEVLSGKHT